MPGTPSQLAVNQESVLGKEGLRPENITIWRSQLAEVLSSRLGRARIIATLMLHPAICRRPVVNMNILCQGKRILRLNKYILLQEHFVDSMAETYNTDDDDTLIHCAYLKMPEQLKLLN